MTGLSTLTNHCGKRKENTTETVVALEINDNAFPVRGKKTDKKTNYKIKRNYGKTNLEPSILNKYIVLLAVIYSFINEKYDYI